MRVSGRQSLNRVFEDQLKEPVDRYEAGGIQARLGKASRTVVPGHIHIVVGGSACPRVTVMPDVTVMNPQVYALTPQSPPLKVYQLLALECNRAHLSIMHVNVCYTVYKKSKNQK